MDQATQRIEQPESSHQVPPDEARRARRRRIIRNVAVAILAIPVLIWLVLFITKGRFLKHPFERFVAGQTHREVEVGGAVRPSAEVFAELGLTPLTLQAKEGLALINGTQLMGSLLALALVLGGGEVIENGERAALERDPRSHYAALLRAGQGAERGLHGAETGAAAVLA